MIDTNLSYFILYSIVTSTYEIENNNYHSFTDDDLEYYSHKNQIGQVQNILKYIS